MKIDQVLVESAGAAVAFAFGRFNPAHQGHIEVWRAVEEAGANWFVGTNPNTIGPNDPLTFQQKSAWMEEIYPPIAGHIIPQTSVLTLAAYIFKKLRNNESASIAYVTDETDWAWSGKLLNQYNGVEGQHGYYKFAQIIHTPSPRVSSATALRDAARADDRVAFYHASGTDPKAKVAGLTYFDTVKQACEKYPLPVKRAKKAKAVEEHIVKVKGGYELKSKHGNKNLGKYPTKAGAEKRERQVQYFKHMGEDEQKTVAKTWDQMNPKEKISGVKGRTVWNEKTKKYYTVFDVPAKEVKEDVDLNKYPIKVYQNKMSGKFVAWVDIKNGDKIFPNVTADTAEAAKQGQIDQIEAKISFKSEPTAGYSLTGLNKYFIKGMLGKRDDNPFWVQLKDKTLFVSEKPVDGFIKFDFDRRQKNHTGAFTANISNARLNSAGLEPGTRYNITPLDISGNIKSFKFDYHSRMEGTWDKLREPIPILGVQKTGRSREVESIDEASLATMRDYFAGDEEARDPYEITKQRLHFSKDKNAKPTLDKRFKSQAEYEDWLRQNHMKHIAGSLHEDDEENEVTKTGQLIPWPAGTTKVHVSDVYDWYKLGQVISDLDDADPNTFGQGAPQTVIAFGSEEEESKLLPLLKRLGLKVDDLDPEGADEIDEAYNASWVYEYLNRKQ